MIVDDVTYTFYTHLQAYVDQPDPALVPAIVERLPSLPLLGLMDPGLKLGFAHLILRTGNINIVQAACPVWHAMRTTQPQKPPGSTSLFRPGAAPQWSGDPHPDVARFWMDASMYDTTQGFLLMEHLLAGQPSPPSPQEEAFQRSLLLVDGVWEEGGVGVDHAVLAMAVALLAGNMPLALQGAIHARLAASPRCLETLHTAYQGFTTSYAIMMVHVHAAPSTLIHLLSQVGVPMHPQRHPFATERLSAHAATAMARRLPDRATLRALLSTPSITYAAACEAVECALLQRPLSASVQDMLNAHAQSPA